MRFVKLISALVVVSAFIAIAVATTASAAETLWKWLPGTVGEAFKGSSGKVTINVKEINGTKIAITCNKSLILLSLGKGELASEFLSEGSTAGKDATLALAILSLESCVLAGLAVNSVGDAAGVILMHLEIHNCMIKPAVFGLLVTPLPLHIELSAVKALLLIRGSFIAELLSKEKEKLLTHKLNVKETEGLQEIKKCEGGLEDTLEGSLDGTTFAKAGIELEKPVIEFDMIDDKEGEEAMEK
jgi:hypothetical protein